MSLFRNLYALMWLLLTPFALIRLWVRSLKQPTLRQHWQERLGAVPSVSADRPVIWLHAVSVGETIAARPLVEALLQQYPDHQLVVSNTTATGRAKAQALFAERVLSVYAPYDFPLFVKRSLKRLRPTLLIVIETELWPCWLHQAALRRIPVLLANARLSPRSAARYAKTRVLWQSVLADVTHIAARNAQDRQGFLAMGASDSQLSVVGNIKYDLPDTAVIRQQGRKQRAHLGLSSRFVWCFASTHRGEDERALSAHQALLRQHPEALLILVPRHPERFDAVHALVAKQGLKQSRWSEREAPNTGDQVFLLDVIGQLMPHFALSDVAVIGGSFVEVGGHNPIEPASLGVPVITGPVIFNFRQEYTDLMSQGAAISVEDTEALTQALLALAVDTKRREHAGQQGLSLVEQNRGVTARLMQRVATLLTD